ncbi:hypothetical protein [Alteriqipengyuania sp. 357]
MIAFAIGSLLCVTVLVALVSSADSLLRGWHSYRALAADLKAIRATHRTAPAARPAGRVRMSRTPAVRGATPRRNATAAALPAAA